MNRTRYRVWLLALVLAAAVFGVFWYVCTAGRESTVTEGTLVLRTEQQTEQQWIASHANREWEGQQI